MSTGWKWVLKALLFVLNVVLALATFNAFIVAGQALLGFGVVLVLSLGIGYFVACELEN